MTNRNTDNKPAVFLSQRPRVRSVDMTHYKPMTVNCGGVSFHCASHNREIMARVAWDGSMGSLTGPVPSDCGRLLERAEIMAGIWGDVADSVNLNRNGRREDSETEGTAHAVKSYRSMVRLDNPEAL